LALAGNLARAALEIPTSEAAMNYRDRLAPSIPFDPAARELGPICIDPVAPNPRPGWPPEARFFMGRRVRLVGDPDRRGYIVGWARLPRGSLAYAVADIIGPGRVGAIPERRLERDD
jgi:hypothetical protein